MRDRLREEYNVNIGNEELVDEDKVLLIKARSGEKSASDELLRKYSSLVNNIAGQFFVPGGDRNDLSQEGMMGLFSAIANYDFSTGIPFKYFAGTCIKRRIVTAIKNSTRQKHIPLNSSISLTQEAFGDSDDGKKVIDTVEVEVPDVADMVASKEMLSKIYAKMSSILSPLEKDVFHYKLNGYTYEQMARIMGKKEKAIDNAWQRIKSKVLKHVIDNDEIDI